jgi:hypothetical protein
MVCSPRTVYGTLSPHIKNRAAVTAVEPRPRPGASAGGVTFDSTGHYEVAPPPPTTHYFVSTRGHAERVANAGQ